MGDFGRSLAPSRGGLPGAAIRAGGRAVDWMGDQDWGRLLMGGESSGTPLETRESSAMISSALASLLRSSGGDFTKFMEALSTAGSSGARASALNNLGYDPSAVGIEPAIARGLTNPADQLRGLFAAMRPMEEMALEESVAGLRSGMGSAGGRFGRTAANAEGRLRSETMARNNANRETSLLQANQQVNQLLAALLSAQGQNAAVSSQSLGDVLRFLQPGAPVYEEGLLPGLLGAGSTIAGLAMTG